MKSKPVQAIKQLGYLLILSIAYVLASFLFRLRVEGKDNIPKDTDNTLIVSSHSSYWDPPLIGIAFGFKARVRFIARKGLLENPVFSIPVRTFSTTIDRDNFGKQDLIKMLKAFKRPGLMCIFPEGTTKDGAAPKSGTVRLAEKTERIFLPVKITISRSPVDFPYLFAPAHIFIGSPISFSDLRQLALQQQGGNRQKKNSDKTSDKTKEALDYLRISEVLMDQINDLGE